MDYLIHFEDGSDGYLAHHGIKGMKWGVWNDETRNKYVGSRGAQKLRNKIDHQAQKLQGAANREANHPEIKRYARQTMKEGRKLTLLQAKYHSKVADHGGQSEPDINGQKIMRAHRNVAIGAALAGPIGGGIAASKSSSKEGLMLEAKATQLNVALARAEAKRGREMTLKLLNDVKSGQKEVVGVTFDGKGGSTYITRNK